MEETKLVGLNDLTNDYFSNHDSVLVVDGPFSVAVRVVGEDVKLVFDDETAGAAWGESAVRRTLGDFGIISLQIFDDRKEQNLPFRQNRVEVVLKIGRADVMRAVGAVLKAMGEL